MEQDKIPQKEAVALALKKQEDKIPEKEAAALRIEKEYKVQLALFLFNHIPVKPICEMIVSTLFSLLEWQSNDCVDHVRHQHSLTVGPAGVRLNSYNFFYPAQPLWNDSHIAFMFHGMECCWLMDITIRDTHAFQSFSAGDEIRIHQRCSDHNPLGLGNLTFLRHRGDDEMEWHDLILEFKACIMHLSRIDMIRQNNTVKMEITIGEQTHQYEFEHLAADNLPIWPTLMFYASANALDNLRMSIVHVPPT